MGIVKTLKGDDGRPYVSLEDLIKEIEEKKQEDKPKYNTIEKPRKKKK